MKNKTVTDIFSEENRRVFQQSIEKSFFSNNVLNPVYMDLPLDDNLFPAPDNWNFFPPLDKTKFNELVISIADLGQLEPIIVWEQPDGRKMILSGHNRTEALRLLRDKTNDIRYNIIHAKVFKYEALSESSARDIIVICNYARRNLNTALIKRCVVHYYKNLDSKDFKGNKLLNTAATFNLTKRTVQYYLSISKMIEAFQLMLENNKINMKCVAILSKFSRENQEWMYRNFSEYISSEKILMINANMNKTTIRKILTKSKNKTVKLTYIVPEESKEIVHKNIIELLNKLDIKTDL